MNAGLNLYSIRNFLDTEENFLSAMLKLKEMGYSYIQFSGAAFDAERITRVSEASGLPVVLTHVPMDRILNDTDALMAEHARFGCKNIGLGMMPKEALADENKCRETIAALEKAAAYMAEKGFKLFYHHHHFEFMRCSDGRTIFDMLVEDAPHVNFTLDTYWLQYGGVDILSTIARVKGRISCVHLKDYHIVAKLGEKISFEPTFAPCGDGTIDFPRVVEAAREAGAEYFLVEQDNAAKMEDPMEQVCRSITYLKTI